MQTRKRSKPEGSLPTYVIREIAAAAQACEHSVRKIASGEPVRGSAGARILDEFVKRGLTDRIAPQITDKLLRMMLLSKLAAGESTEKIFREQLTRTIAKGGIGS